jgi:ribose 5-phosphate isomerase B
MLLAIASDHAGVALKEVLKQEAGNLGYEVLDLGTNSTESVDYPDYGYMVADNVASGRAQVGVVICGSGIGISIAANRNPKIRAALCFNPEMAKLARQHNDANVLALGARFIDEKTAKDCLKEFLGTEFEGGRHAKRVDKL